MIVDRSGSATHFRVVRQKCRTPGSSRRSGFRSTFGRLVCTDSQLAPRTPDFSNLEIRQIFTKPSQPNSLRAGRRSVEGVKIEALREAVVTSYPSGYDGASRDLAW